MVTPDQPMVNTCPAGTYCGASKSGGYVDCFLAEQFADCSVSDPTGSNPNVGETCAASPPEPCPVETAGGPAAQEPTDCQQKLDTLKKDIMNIYAKGQQFTAGGKTEWRSFYAASDPSLRDAYLAALGQFAYASYAGQLKDAACGSQGSLCNARKLTDCIKNAITTELNKSFRSPSSAAVAAVRPALHSLLSLYAQVKKNEQKVNALNFMIRVRSEQKRFDEVNKLLQDPALKPDGQLSNALNNLNKALDANGKPLTAEGTKIGMPWAHYAMYNQWALRKSLMAGKLSHIASFYKTADEKKQVAAVLNEYFTSWGYAGSSNLFQTGAKTKEFITNLKLVAEQEAATKKNALDKLMAKLRVMHTQIAQGIKYGDPSLDSLESAAASSRGVCRHKAGLFVCAANTIIDEKDPIAYYAAGMPDFYPRT